MTTEGSSFDPRTWTEPGAAPAKNKVAAAAPPAARDRRQMMALGGSALVLIIGMTAARLSYHKPLPQTAEVSAAPRPPALSRRTLALPDPAGLGAALIAAGIDPAQASAAAQAALAIIGTRHGQLHTVASLDASGNTGEGLVRLEASFDDSSGAVVTRDAAGHFTGSKVEASLQTEIRVVRGEIDAESFYSSAVAAGVTDTLIPQIAKALAFDFDFQREIRPGDVFEIAAEQDKNASGQAVGIPRLVFVSLTTQDKARSLYWFKPDGEDGGWFDGNGSSIIRALMRTPIDGARVSSSFGMREHPVLGFMKMHKGTDFAAPIGTPIFAAGDAQIEFAGPKGPNGNFVKLLHPNGWETLYLHMNRFMDGITTGAHVRQGQQIGEVGTTGRSTGPHLHYEVHIDGEPVDSMSVKTEQGRLLMGPVHDAFVRQRDRIDVSRARQAN
jgi:murein DD-endopeptidase MepM/ murein hydrolase activator NlpD